MPQLTLVMAYYDNPKMLEKQYAHWATYTQEVKDAIEIVLVDDGSPRAPLSGVPVPADLPVLRAYRILEDRPWHQNGARNLGAFEAKGEWLLLTDMDHMVPEATMRKALTKVKRHLVYRFERIDARTMQPTIDRHGLPKPHPNSWLMTHEMYWKIGGYDERTCGYYGTDSFFRADIQVHARLALLPAPLLRFDREDVADASTTTLKRKEGRVHGWRERLAKKMQYEPGKHTLRFKWERVL